MHSDAEGHEMSVRLPAPRVLIRLACQADALPAGRVEMMAAAPGLTATHKTAEGHEIPTSW
jgi:hypothetical protein